MVLNSYLRYLSARMTGGQADRRAGGQADRRTGRQTGGQVGRQADRHTGGQVYAAIPSPHGFCFEVVLGTEPGPHER